MERKFYPLDRFPGYMISTKGDVTNPNGNLLKPVITCSTLCYNIHNVGYAIAKLVWETFIGEINTYIRYSDGNELNVDIKNLYVDLDIEQLSSTKYLINDIAYQVIPGFSAYVISRKGTVYSLKRRQFVARSFNHANYPTVTLVDDNGFRSPRKVHRLVYLTYVGPLNSELVIDHIDSNKLNPSVENLRQISNRENICRAYSNNDYYVFKSIDDYNINDNLPYKENEIEKICKMMAENKPHDEILVRLGYEYTNANYNSLVSTTTKLRNREIYRDIADKYNVPEKPKFGKGAFTTFFSPSDIQFIIDEFMRGRPQQSLANVFGCKQSTISLAIKRSIPDLIDVEGSTTIERVS